MHPLQILQAEMLDILFEGRNKEYGAYVLRKQYHSRMIAALLITAGIVSVLITWWFLYGEPSKLYLRTKPFVIEVSTKLQPPPNKIYSPIRSIKPPSPLKRKPPQTAFVKPLIVRDNPDLKHDFPPIEKMVDALISTQTGKGDGPADQITLPGPQGPEINSLKSDGKDDGPFAVLDIESVYPGGMNAWTRFLIKTIHYPDRASENKIQGTVIVQFIVDEQGNVSDVHAISGPDELKWEALRVISKSGKWVPARSRNNNVKSYKKQAIVFRISE